MTVKYPKATINLVGEDGNAFSILARTKTALRKAGVSAEEQNAYFDEATSGDYDHLLLTTMRWVTCDAGEWVENETEVCHSCNLESDIYADGMCEMCWMEEEDPDNMEE